MTNDTDMFVSHVKKYYNDQEINVIFDLGSRDGDTAIALSTHYPHSKVFTFECNPAVIDNIVSKIKPYSNITLLQYAAHNITSDIDFFPCSSNIGASSVFMSSNKYDYIERYVQTHTSVKSIRLDELIDNHQILPPDLIFADIQGSELYALQGLGKYLSGVKAIQLEVEFREMYSGQPLYEDVMLFLNQNNFKEIWQAKYHDNFWGECIVVNTSMSDLDG